MTFPPLLAGREDYIQKLMDIGIKIEPIEVQRMITRYTERSTKFQCKTPDYPGFGIIGDEDEAFCCRICKQKLIVYIAWRVIHSKVVRLSRSH